MAGAEEKHYSAEIGEDARYGTIVPPERKVPVLLVGNFLSADGNRSVCEDLAARLTLARWVVLTTSHKPGRLSRSADMVSTAWRRRHDYAVAHVDVFSGSAFVWAEAVCEVLRLAGKPYILTLHGGNLPAFAQRWPGRVRRLLCFAAAVTAPSRYLLNEMARYCATLQLLPNPLDVSAYRFRLRRRLQPSLVWLRSMHATYNPTLAPEVLARLVKRFPNANLTMIGPDKGDGSLQDVRRRTKALGLGTRVELPGRVAKTAVGKWLSRGDIFLNTTNVENTPVSVLEAMACGLCTVSTNVGGIRYLLEHERDALLVPPDDPEMMAAAVSRLLRDPDLAERLSRNAREKAAQFDWSLLLPQWEALLISATVGKLRG